MPRARVPACQAAMQRGATSSQLRPEQAKSIPNWGQQLRASTSRMHRLPPDLAGAPGEVQGVAESRGLVG